MTASPLEEGLTEEIEEVSNNTGIIPVVLLCLNSTMCALCYQLMSNCIDNQT